MRKEVVVLSEASSDIEQGMDFYNLIEEDLGSYFRDSIMADLRRLGFYFGQHSCITAFAGCFHPDSLSQYIIATWMTSGRSWRYWI